MSANQLGVFTVLADGPRTAEEVAAACGTHPRSTAMLLNAAVGQGLLERRDEGYSNSNLADSFLVEGRPAYLGNALKYAEDVYPAWGGLTESVRHNAPAMPAETILGADPEKTRNFVFAMHDRARGIARALTACIDLSGCKQLLDVGGGPGTYSILLVERYSELHSSVLDLPEIVAISEEIIAGSGCADRVRVIPGNYLETDFEGGNDVVLMSGMMHREKPEVCEMLLSKAYRSLIPGGQVVVADVFFEDAAKDSPVFATLFALNMMLTSEHGSAHAKTEMAEWMEGAGFQEITTTPLPPPMPHTILNGVKL